MQQYYILRQPVPFGGGQGSGFFGPFQGLIPPGFGPGPGFPPGPPSGFPPGPPFGPPSGFPPGPPFGPPSGFPPGPPSGSPSGPPSGPPPSFTPQQALQGPGVFAVDPGAIRRCLNRYVYIWLENGQQFWAWLTFVGRNSAAGWRWTGFNWLYFGIDLDRISSFTCF